MAVAILTTAASIQCPHGGRVILPPSQTVVKIQGAPVLLATDVHAVAGCPFMMGLKYSPCVTVRWTAPATQAKINGTPVLLRSSVGLCQNGEQAPQGSAIIASVQSEATAI